ncbi:MAG: NAD(P)-dependent oxidoreductase [Albidovulum sp.]|nr:NAD(P)-dependent oxidoreductase [Albidovulum sp.]
MTKPVGIFGLGLIGMALAERLLAAGHGVVGYDVDEGRGALLRKKGGMPADPEAIWKSDIILSAVFSGGQLADIIAAAPDVTDIVLVAMSTCDPDQIAELADTARKRSIVLVEAPISGTSRQVLEGTALLLLAGDPAGLDAFERVADAISPNRERVGAIGNGNKTKLAINCVLGLNRVAVAEGLVFAEALGLDPANYLQTAMRSAARSDVMTAKGPMMVARDFSPLGRIAQSQKDFKLIREIAVRNGHGNMPMVNRYLEVMENAEQAGDSDLDNSAVFLAVSRMAQS